MWNIELNDIELGFVFVCVCLRICIQICHLNNNYKKKSYAKEWALLSGITFPLFKRLPHTHTLTHTSHITANATKFRLLIISKHSCESLKTKWSERYNKRNSVEIFNSLRVCAFCMNENVLLSTYLLPAFTMLVFFQEFQDQLKRCAC